MITNGVNITKRIAQTCRISSLTRLPIESFEVGGKKAMMKPKRLAINPRLLRRIIPKLPPGTRKGRCTSGRLKRRTIAAENKSMYIVK